MFLLKRLSGFLGKYLWVALVATSISTATFAYLYKEALQDVARVEAEAQRDAALAANERAAEVTAELEATMAERERVLQARIEESNRITREARERAEAAEQLLGDFETERQSDVTPEYTEWADDEVPESVVTRLRSLQEAEQ